jgi:hypothetical protein
VEILIPSYRHDMVWLPTLLLPEVLIGLVICELRQSGRPGFSHVHSLGLGAAPARPHTRHGYLRAPQEMPGFSIGWVVLVPFKGPTLG